jgi:hypothetical protein
VIRSERGRDYNVLDFENQKVAFGINTADSNCMSQHLDKKMIFLSFLFGVQKAKNEMCRNRNEKKLSFDHQNESWK